MRQRLFVLVMSLATFPAFACAIHDEAEFRKALVAHPVIKAAMVEAKRFSGAKRCSVVLQQFAPLSQFKAGTAYEYDATITCSSPVRGEGESDGLVTVKGNWLKNMPWEMTVKTAFAG